MSWSVGGTPDPAGARAPGALSVAVAAVEDAGEALPEARGAAGAPDEVTSAAGHSARVVGPRFSSWPKRSARLSLLRSKPRPRFPTIARSAASTALPPDPEPALGSPPCTISPAWRQP